MATATRQDDQGNLVQVGEVISGVWVFNMLVCMMYRLYSTNLVCLANERFWYWYGWNPYL